MDDQSYKKFVFPKFLPEKSTSIPDNILHSVKKDGGFAGEGSVDSVEEGSEIKASSATKAGFAKEVLAKQATAEVTTDIRGDARSDTGFGKRKISKWMPGWPDAAQNTGEYSFQDSLAVERMVYEGAVREPEFKAQAKNMTERAARQGAMEQKMMNEKKADQKPLNQKTAGQKTGAAMQRPRLIAIANQKGGVGKTTTAINLATALCAVGKKVLLMDLDPQGNASTGLGVRRSAIRTSVYDVLFDDADIIEAAVTTRVPNLSVVPSSIHLSGAEIELVTAENREYRLKKALHRPLPFDYVIVDCPPSLNLLTLNALVAMDSILVPLQCEFYALEGLSHLVKTIERVQKSFNPGLDIHGVVLTMYDQRNKLSAMVEDDVRKHFGDKVYKTVIPRNVRLSEAPSYGLPAIIYDMKCSGAQAYIMLAREVIQRERSIANAAANNVVQDDGSVRVA